MMIGSTALAPNVYEDPSGRLWNYEVSTGELLERVLHRADHHAFEKLFGRYYHELCRYSRKFLPQPELAEEVVGDVFMNLWRNRGNYHIESSPASYLFVATRNRSYDYARKLQRTNSEPLEVAAHVVSAEASAIEQLEATDLEIIIQNAIEALPPSCRQVFALSREQGLKYQQIADHLGISIKTVETQMGRALKFIREKVGAQVGQPLM